MYIIAMCCVGVRSSVGVFLSLSSAAFQLIVQLESPQWYGDGAGNAVEENSSVFFLIQMR